MQAEHGDRGARRGLWSANMRLALVNFKGGVGKTTVAMCLAVPAAVDGPTLLVDGDPQGTASKWWDTARRNGEPFLADLVHAASPTEMRAADFDDYRHVIIDCPPGNAAIATEAVARADLTVVPTQPSALDLWQAFDTMAWAGDLGAPAVLLLTAVRAGTVSASAAAITIEEADQPRLQSTIPRREAFVQMGGTHPRRVSQFRFVLDEMAAVVDELERMRT